MTGLLVFFTACSGPADNPLETATIKDIMGSMIDPSADFLFESVAQIADENGISERAPKTDEEWERVRREAFILFEAPNLLIMEGRKVARPGDKAAYPQVELQPEEIQRLLDDDRSSFIRRAQRLQEAAAMAVSAAEAKDKNALFASLQSIDKACENCHLHYWYPNDQRAVEAAKESGIID